MSIFWGLSEFAAVIFVGTELLFDKVAEGWSLSTVHFLRTDSTIACFCANVSCCFCGCCWLVFAFCWFPSSSWSFGLPLAICCISFASMVLRSVWLLVISGPLLEFVTVFLWREIALKSMCELITWTFSGECSMTLTFLLVVFMLGSSSASDFGKKEDGIKKAELPPLWVLRWLEIPPLAFSSTDFMLRQLLVGWVGR